MLVSDVVSACKDELLQDFREEQNRLEGAVTTTATSLITEFDLRSLQRGVYAEIGDELIYVWDATAASKTCDPIQRAQRSTTAVQHSDGDVVTVAPRFPRYRIRKMIEREIRSWPTDVFDVGTVEVAVGTASRAYNLGISGSYYHVLGASVSPLSGEESNWRELTSLRVDRNADTGDFASGSSITFPGTFDSTRTVRVAYSKPFTLTSLADSVDVETGLGLDLSMVDVVIAGVCWRMLASREARRTFTEEQHESRTAEQVPPMHTVQAAERAFKRMRDDRLKEEARRLKALFPYKF